jgi:hypothetical protein
MTQPAPDKGARHTRGSDDVAKKRRTTVGRFRGHGQRTFIVCGLQKDGAGKQRRKKNSAENSGGK